MENRIQVNLIVASLIAVRRLLSADVLATVLAEWYRDRRESLLDIAGRHGLMTEVTRADLEAEARQVCALETTTVIPPAPSPPPTDSSGAGFRPAFRFTPVRWIDRGGQGDVFVARDEEVERDVALKQLREHDGEASARKRDQFLAEGRLTGRLEHPGVVPVYGLGRGPDGRPYYAMRLVSGESLQDAIDRFHAAEAGPSRDPAERSLAFRDLLSRFISVCQTAAFAHSRGVIHRDLKPANVMLGAYGETLVVDWGLAKVVEAGDDSGGFRLPGVAEQTEQGTRKGTPAYMAPEQDEGRVENIDFRTDVYLLGGIIFHLLCGEAPHAGGRRAQSLISPRSRKPGPPGVPDELDRITAKALSPDPPNRYQSALDLMRDVEVWLRDEPLTAYRDWINQVAREIERSPGDRELRQQRARLLTNVGLVLNGMGRVAEAEESFREAVNACEALMADSPNDARYRADLANTLLHLAQSFRLRGRAADAAEAERRAVNEYELLRASFPQDYRTNPASILLTLHAGSWLDHATTGPREPVTAGIPGEEVPADHTFVPEPDIRVADETVGSARPTGSLTILEELARTGASFIRLARDNDLGRIVVIKELAPHGNSPERFAREARITARLEHPNIIPVYGMGSRANMGQPFIILRYLTGRTLAEAIRDYHTGTGDGRSAAFLGLLNAFLAACDALSFAHSRGVIHRDPKPSNILIGEHGQVVLADWGLARAAGEPELQPSGGQPPLNEPAITRTDTVLGTPVYMAPEQALGDAITSGPRMDIYALGAVLFEILTGERVHAETSLDEIRQGLSQRRTRTPRSLNPTVPRALEAICLRALQYNPLDRYPSVTSLAADVRAWMRGARVSVHKDRIDRQISRVLARWFGRAQRVPASKASLGR